VKSVLCVLGCAAAAAIAAGGSAAQPARLLLVVSVDRDGTISVTEPGKRRLTHLVAGRYRIVVHDRAGGQNVHVHGSRVDRRTGLGFRGTVEWQVELFAGWDYLFFSDARPRQRVRFRAEFCTCHL
jgi:hypothetical protein